MPSRGPHTGHLPGLGRWPAALPQPCGPSPAASTQDETFPFSALFLPGWLVSSWQLPGGWPAELAQELRAPRGPGSGPCGLPSAGPTPDTPPSSPPTRPCLLAGLGPEEVRCGAWSCRAEFFLRARPTSGSGHGPDLPPPPSPSPLCFSHTPGLDPAGRTLSSPLPCFPSLWLPGEGQGTSSPACSQHALALPVAREKTAVGALEPGSCLHRM